MRNGQIQHFLFKFVEEDYANPNALPFFSPFFKRREQTAMVEYILSTITLVLRNGKTPEVKGKKLPVTSI